MKLESSDSLKEKVISHLRGKTGGIGLGGPGGKGIGGGGAGGAGGNSSGGNPQAIIEAAKEELGMK